MRKEQTLHIFFLQTYNLHTRIKHSQNKKYLITQER